MGGVWELQIRIARSILTFLSKTHSTSLNDESLHTSFYFTSSITDLLSDINSMIPLSLVNLLTFKSRVVMPPSGVFTAPDIYCCKH